MRAMFRSHTEEALAALLKALKEPRYRVAAASVLLAYGYGRPAVANDLELPGNDGDTTLTIRVVYPEQQSSVSGVNGATRVIPLPPPANEDD